MFDQTVQLEPEAGPIVHLDAGESIRGATVIATQGATDAPVAGATIRYRVLLGDLELGDGRHREATVTADDRGRATVLLFMARKGAAILAAHAGADEDAVVFTVRTAGVPDTLSVHGAASYPADGGEIDVAIAAVDHKGRPVDGATIELEGTPGGDDVLTGKVKGLGRGQYRGTLKTRRAGAWTLTASCRDTGALVVHHVIVTPAKPARIVVPHTPDPRDEKPYGEVVIRARLEDKHGNAIDPRGLVATAKRRALTSWIAGDEARFLLRQDGYAEVPVDIVDRRSRRRYKLSVNFASAWFDAPRVVRPETAFGMPLFLTPAAGAKVNQAVVEIAYDRKAVSFGGFTPPKGPGLQVSAEHKPGRVTITVRSERRRIPVMPDGVPIGEILWQCTSASEACFSAQATMSPTGREWIRCVEQKYDNPLCICVNLIYLQGQRAHRVIAREAYRQFVRINIVNIYYCCPYIRFKEDLREITGAEWLQMRAQLWGGRAAPAIIGDVEAMMNSGIGRKADCINIYAVPSTMATVWGLASNTVGGSVWVDTTKFATVPNVGAHEIGHALGLQHSNDSARLMYRTTPPGHWISSAECDTIKENAGNFPCA